MTQTCSCGGRLVGHGQRSVTLLDYENGRFGQIAFDVRRLRCRGCGSISIADPELTTGGVGRATKAAAYRIRAIALEDGYEVAATASGVTLSTVSRIVSALTRADQTRAPRPSPMIVSVGARDLTTIASVDGEQATSFPDVASAVSWIAQEPPGVILADIAAIPALRGLEGVQIVLPKHAFAQAVWRTMPSAGRAFVEAASGGRRLAMLLGSSPEALRKSEKAELAAAAPAGSPARGFIRKRDGLLATHEVDDIDLARGRMSGWKGGLDDFWRRTFRSALDFVGEFEPEILAHHSALTTPWPRLSLEMKGPAPVFVARLVARM